MAFTILFQFLFFPIPYPCLFTHSLWLSSWNNYLAELYTTKIYFNTWTLYTKLLLWVQIGELFLKCTFPFLILVYVRTGSGNVPWRRAYQPVLFMEMDIISPLMTSVIFSMGNVNIHSCRYQALVSCFHWRSCLDLTQKAIFFWSNSTSFLFRIIVARTVPPRDHSESSVKIFLVAPLAPLVLNLLKCSSKWVTLLQHWWSTINSLVFPPPPQKNLPK